jgi:hypothetical protein
LPTLIFWKPRRHYHSTVKQQFWILEATEVAILNITCLSNRVVEPHASSIPERLPIIDAFIVLDLAATFSEQ